MKHHFALSISILNKFLLTADADNSIRTIAFLYTHLLHCADNTYLMLSAPDITIYPSRESPIRILMFYLTLEHVFIFNKLHVSCQ